MSMFAHLCRVYQEVLLRSIPMGEENNVGYGEGEVRQSKKSVVSTRVPTPRDTSNNKEAWDFIFLYSLIWISPWEGSVSFGNTADFK